MDLSWLLGETLSGPENWILLGLPLGALLLLIGLFAGDPAAALNRRIARVKLNHQRSVPSTAQISIARSHNRSSDIRALDQLIKRLVPQQDVLRLRIQRAGLGISLGVYVLTSALVGVIGLVLSATFAHLPWAAAALFGAMCGLGLPHMFIGMRIKRRQTQFIDLFPDAIDLMVRGIKAGLPIAESMKTAGDEVPDPVGGELKRITDSVRLGRPTEEVLWEASRRLDVQEFNFFTIALAIQGETGGNLAETLNNLSDVLRGRRQLKRKIKALSSEAKASAYIIGSLPFIMALLIYLVNSSYIMGLFMDVRGQFMVGFGLFMIAAGAVVMYRMVKFEL